MSPRTNPRLGSRMHGDKRSPAPTLAELQERVDRWIRQFEEGYWPPLSMLARLTEEVGELARELNHHFGHKPKKADEPPGEIALEMADIIFVLVCLSNSLGIDLADAFERAMQKYDARDAERWTPRSPPRAAPRAPRRATGRAGRSRAGSARAGRPSAGRSRSVRASGGAVGRRPGAR